jgi:sigma-E factor negative regulatory protein RseA
MQSGNAISNSEAMTGAGEKSERLSAWLDGELDEAGAVSQLDELLRDQSCRKKFDDWSAVGDALRSYEVLAEHSPRLCARISAALQDEPLLLAPRALPSRMKRNLASGFAVAAAAAVLVLVALPQLRGTGVPAPGAAASAALAAANNAGVAGDASPVALSDAQRRAEANPRLAPYLQAHRDVTGNNGMMPAAAVYLRFGSDGDR